MNQKIIQILFQFIITITLFSLWAGFALLKVNKSFYQELPGYKIGRLCIWEFAAIIISALLARFMIKKWGNIGFQEMHGNKVLTMNLKFGMYFLLYFLLAIITGAWQFWIFSQKF